ncbi:hypothetical protein NA78x_000349 [Anatilimnocola sp. NA78]|uniref:hypothetical protein n=1 Tax=Anatilimnocola sp. NA78 TaxID=3415683 RepID=UPI003CE46896
MELILTNSEHVATVDDVFYSTLLALGPWRLHAGYVVMADHKYRPLAGTVLQLSGEFVPGYHYQTDDRLDNRLSNLRVATRSQMSFTRRPNRNSSTGFKGVSPFRNKWQAGIKVDGRRIFLGLFTSPIEAAKAYDAAALEHFGNHGLNFDATHSL